MTTAPVTPLRKKNANGKVYTRLPNIEAQLVEIHALTRNEIAARCAVRDTKSATYLPSECLLHLIREHRSSPIDACSETLYRTLLEHVLLGLPQAESKDGKSVRLTDDNVCDEGRHRFLKMLARDRLEYVEGLDFFEVRFARTLKTLRVDAQRKVYRHDDPLESITTDHETGEIAEKVERAAGSFDPFGSDAIEDFDYRLRLDEAISDLPALQKAIVVMIQKGIPIESKDPNILSIAMALKKSEKTIRTHRDKAYATLRSTLSNGETQ